jgi:hypothetical protein
MKFKTHTAAFAAAAVCLLTVPAAFGATYTAGDLLMGIRATGGQGFGTTYVVNIGQASNFRDEVTTGNIAIAGNFTADLVTLYGSTWYNRTDLVWGIAGTPSNTATVGADEAATMYASKSQSTPGVSGSAWTISGLATRTSVSTLMTGMQSGFAAYTASGNSSAGTIQLDTDANDWRSFMAAGGDPTRTGGNKDFGGFADIEGPVTNQLSLFRLDGPTNVGTFEGSFSLGQAGLSFVPEPASSALAAFGAVALVLRRRRSA